MAHASTPKPENILVTGGAGFIGCNLVRFLLEQGCRVTVFDNFATGKRENLTEIMDRITLIEADLRDAKAVADACEGVEVIFHEGALGSVPRSVAEPLVSHDVNVNGTINVLEAARASDTVRRVVFAASSSAYGDQPDSPKHEGMPPSPNSPYAANKLACEAYLRAYAKSYGLATLSLRYFNVFGPHQDPNGAYAAVIPAFVAALLAGRTPVVYGDGEQTRDFCYIDNVVKANWLAATAPDAVCDGRVMNVACNRKTSLNEILALLGELLEVEVKAEYRDERPGDVKHSLADFSLARESIGYEPEVYFDQGLRKAIDWYKANLG